MKNINRIFCFVLVLCFVFSLSSCNDGNEIIESDSVQSEIDLDGYENIECKTSKGTETRYFSFDDSDTSALSVAFPVEWTIREGDVAAFKSFVDLCKASNTPIVIFPAHNEKNGANAANAYPDAYYLNWKGELDTLISNGVNRWDLCVDDYYDHSLPLAGYVGAHMIYRALFGEMPPILNEYDNGLYHSTVTQKLGDYAQTGCLPLIDGDVRIYKMN